MCACTWPSSANVDRSVGRASFWLRTRIPSYSTHSDESPIGPSVGEVSAWIMTFRPPSSSITSSETVSRNCVKPSSSQLVAQFRRRVRRQQHRRLLADEAREVRGVEMVPVQVGHVEVVAVAERLPVEPGVVRERKPGREVRGIDPRVAQDAARRRVDPHARVTGAGDPYRGHSPKLQQHRLPGSRRARGQVVTHSP